MNVYVRKSASHKIGSDCSNEQTRVRPYAGQTHSVTCAPSNVCNVPHWKKISASDNEMNCRERQVPNAVAYAENFHGGVSKCQNFSLH